MLNKRISSYNPYSTGLRRRVSKAGGHVLESVSNRASIWLKDVPRRDGLEAPSASLVDLSLASAGTLKRPTSLSRHASAAGLPLSPAVPRGFGKGPKPHAAYSPCEGGEGIHVEPEEISQLLSDVARFAERLEKLRDVVLQEDGLESRRPLAHECLGEALRILRQVISKYPLLNTLETLTAAGTLISKVKGFHYESNFEADKREFEKALEMIAVSFSSTVSEFLMGEIDNSTLLSIPPTDQSQSMENLYGGIPPQSPEDLSEGTEDFSSVRLSAEEVDVLLQRCEGGVDVALKYVKNISKYMKDLICYLEKRTALEIEFAKGLQKMVNSCKQTITQEPYMPFLSIYSLALEQDLEYSLSAQQAAHTLRMETFLQPLTTRRMEHEKRRKEIKDQWHRAQRKLQEAEANLRKAKQTYLQRSEESEKAKHAMAKAEEEQLSSSSNTTTGTKALEKKRRLEEEARNKAEEAMATYRTCIADANTQKQELEDTKVTSLRQIHELVKQSDQVIKSATISFYQSMHMQTAPLPVYFQTMCESSKLYDPGQQYASHVKRLQRGDEPETQYDFEPYVSQNNWSLLTRARKGSFTAGDFTTGSVSEGCGKEEGASEGESPTLRDTQRRPGSGLEQRDGFAQRLQSPNGTISPGEESDGNSPSFEQAHTGPFRHVGLSKAAQTHRLRKLRTPSKCRECNSYVYFQGAECEECYLACHKKCLETLAIQCGHKKLQGKLQLFGQDFRQAARTSPDSVPFIVKKCICEIERRAVKTKGIYRVNGVKTRVEKLCQAFENGKELVELSQASPHDISNVLKLYLRQLPEPIMPFRMYNSLMGLAKDSLQGGAEGKSSKNIVELLDKGAETEKVVVTLVTKLKELVDDLPPENFATLKYIVHHLRRIIEVEQDNKMTSGNLGIVFGPTLMRPRPTQATISLSSLVDYPHQARIVEALIIFYPTLFESDSRPPDVVGEATQEDGNPSEDQEDTRLGTHDGVAYLGATEEQGEAALQEDLYSGSHARFIDSDSEPEDGPAGEAEQPGATLQGSESSGDEENPLTDEGSEEGTLSRSGSVGQTDAENVPTPQRCPAQAEDGRKEGEKSAVSGEEGDGDGKADGSPLD